MRLILVRHGQDDPDYRGGWSQRGLIEKGIRQAQSLGQRLKDNYMPIDHIVSSDLNRAKETTDIILNYIDKPVEYHQSFREMNNGDLAGIPNDTALEKYPGLFFKTLDYNEKYPNGESPSDFYNRTIRAFKDLLHTDKDNVLLVTHGGVISILIHYIKNIEWSNKLPMTKTSPTGIFEIHYDNHKYNIISENDEKHLGHVLD